MCSPHRGESVPLLSVEEADSFSRQKRECLLDTEERVPLRYIFSTHRRECPSATCRGGILSIQRIECLIYTEERVSLLLLYTEERVSSLHGEESAPPLSVEEADSFSVQRRECHLSTEDRVSLCYM